MVESLSAKQEMQVQSLGQEDPLEKGTATHSTILVWRNPWTEEPGGLQFMGSKEADTTEVTEQQRGALLILNISQSPSKTQRFPIACSHPHLGSGVVVEGSGYTCWQQSTSMGLQSITSFFFINLPFSNKDLGGLERILSVEMFDVS